jgi:hypothetical protein
VAASEAEENSCNVDPNEPVPPQNPVNGAIVDVSVLAVKLPTPMLHLLYVLLATARASLKPQRELALQTLASRQQLAIVLQTTSHRATHPSVEGWCVPTFPEEGNWTRAAFHDACRSSLAHGSHPSLTQQGMCRCSVGLACRIAIACNDDGVGTV